MLELMQCAVSLPRPRRRPSAGQRGFTLVELMVVLIVVALIVGIAIPNLRRAMVRADLMDEVKMVRQAIGVARINAIKNSRRVAMLLVPNATDEHFDHTVTAWVDDNADGAMDAAEEVIGRWPLGPKTTIRSAESYNSNWSLQGLAGDAEGVVFLPDGSAIVHENQVGVGEGGFVLADRVDNRILIRVRASGTVQEWMWDGSGWSTELKHWRY